MTRCCAYILFGAACLLAASGTGAEPPRLEAVLSPPETPYHRSVLYAVTVEASPETRYEFPELSSADKTIEVRKAELISAPVSEGTLRRTQYYRINPISPGLYRVPLLSISWQEGSERGVLDAPSVAFTARELTEAEAEAAARFAGITAPDALLPEKGFSWPAMAGGAATAMAAVAILFALRHYRRQQAGPVTPPPPAWETALNRLRELQQRDLPGSGKLELYYVDLSSIVRYYIEDRFQIQAPEQTTPEFLEAAAARGVFSEAQEEFLTLFLRQCDRIKFAKLEPDVEGAREHFKQVRLFVKDTIPADVEMEMVESAA